ADIKASLKYPPKSLLTDEFYKNRLGNKIFFDNLDYERKSNLFEFNSSEYIINDDLIRERERAISKLVIDFLSKTIVEPEI
ncbi:hypothetical protein AB4082_11525, partial [Vibrio cyclitrophicus]